MSKIVADFKALPLPKQHEVFSAITAIYTAAKEARRQELESEIRAMGVRPDEGKKLPAVAAKHRSKKDLSKTWRAVARNLNEQFKQLELVFEQCRQHGVAMQAAKLATPPPRPKEAVELVPWPPHMRFD